MEEVLSEFPDEYPESSVSLGVSWDLRVIFNSFESGPLPSSAVLVSVEVDSDIWVRDEIDEQLDLRYRTVLPFWVTWWWLMGTFGAILFIVGTFIQCLYRSRGVQYNIHIVWRWFFKVVSKKILDDSPGRSHGDLWDICSQQVILFVSNQDHWITQKAQYSKACLLSFFLRSQQTTANFLFNTLYVYCSEWADCFFVDAWRMILEDRWR